MEFKLLEFGLSYFELSHFGLSSIIKTHLAYELRLAYVENLIGLSRNDFGLCIGIKRGLNQQSFLFYKAFIILIHQMLLIKVNIYIFNVSIHLMLLINLIILIFSFSIHQMLLINNFHFSFLIFQYSSCCQSKLLRIEF